MRLLGRVRLSSRQSQSPSHFRFVFFWLAAALCIFFTFAVPPFQKPDEVVHFWRTVSVARGNIVCKTVAGVDQNFLPAYLVTFPTEQFVGGITHNQQAKYPLQLFAQSLWNTKQRDTGLVNEPSACSLPFLPYLPAAFVLAVPTALHVNPMVLFYLGRLTNCLLGIAIVWFALTKAPKKSQLAVISVFALPMTLFQLSSYSKDSLHLSLALLGFAWFAALFEQKKPASRAQLLLLVCTLGLVVLARPQYALLLAIPFALKLKLPSAKRITAIAVAAGVVFCVAVVLAVSLSLQVFAQHALSLQYDSPDLFVYPLDQVRHIAGNPLGFGAVLNRTIQTNFEFYGTSLIGILGWLDYSLPWYAYVFYGGTIAAAILSCKPSEPDEGGRHTLVGAILLGTVAIIFTSFYVFNTPLAGREIEGVQGRYFLALLPFAIWWLGSLLNNTRHTSLIILAAAVTSAVGISTLHRYYWYPDFYLQSELAFQLPSLEVLMAEKLVVTDAYTATLTVDPDKKLTGIALIPLANTHATTTPYSLTVLDTTCTVPQRKTSISAEELVPAEYTQAIFSPLPTNTTSVCVRVSPYLVKPDEARQLTLATHQSQAILVPIYLR